MNPFPAPVGADDPGGPLVRLPLECVGAVINRPGKCRPPDGGQEGLAPARGLAQPGCTPHFLFPLVEKKTGRARSKRKGRLARSGAFVPPRDGGRRIGASADFGLPSGTLSSSAISGTAVPWRMVRRSSGWLSHCLCFSFRCRWPSRAGTGATGGCGHPPESINPYDHPGSA